LCFLRKIERKDLCRVKLKITFLIKSWGMCKRIF
jgi:hypothetical protein